jgi:hypothetical protein
MNAVDILKTVFEVCLRDNKIYSVSGLGLRILMHADGKRNVLELDKIAGIEMNLLEQTVLELLEQKLIRPVNNNAGSLIDSDFINFLTDRMSIIVGPIAQVIVEDAINDIGKGKEIPFSRAAEVAELLSKQISDDSQKVEFIKSVMTKIKVSQSNNM